MTFRHKLQAKNPKASKETIDHIISGDCPYEYGWEQEPGGGWCKGRGCEDCWNREAPATSKTTRDPAMIYTNKVIFGGD